MRLLDDEGAAVSDGGERTQTSQALGPGEQRPFQLMLELDVDLQPGRSAAVEARLLEPAARDRLVGSLGVALLPAGLT